jgi:peptide/nickel transport system permease protein
VKLVFYAIRRAVIAFCLLVALTFVTYVIFWQIPSDPACYVLPCGPTRHPPASEYKHVRHEMGVDRPIIVQYADFLSRAVRGDLGTAWTGMYLDQQTNKLQPGPSVGSTLGDALRVTGSVVFGGVVILLLVTIPVGLLAASRPNSVFDRTVLAVSLVAISTHPIVVGTVLQTFAGKDWQLVPIQGYCPLIGSQTGGPGFNFATNQATPFCGGPRDWASHLILPWITFALFFVAIYLRMIRVTVMEALGSQYVRTARAKGAGEWRVLRVHAFRNALLPILTMVGMDIGVALGISLYIEAVYGLPGLGHVALAALNGSVGFDLPFIVGLVLVVGIVVIGLNLVIDIAYAALDPRIGAGGRERRRAFGGLA